MTRPLSDSRIRGRASGYVGGPTGSADPPCLIQCPHCRETVIAAHRMYFDNPGEKHKHQPSLGKSYKGNPFEAAVGQSPTPL